MALIDTYRNLRQGFREAVPLSVRKVITNPFVNPASRLPFIAAKATFTLIGKVNNTSDVSNAGTQGSTDLASVYRAVSAYI